jgi:hypothetical protein
MTALGVLFVGFGVLTMWAGFDRTNIFDLLRTFIGAPTPKRKPSGALA